MSNAHAVGEGEKKRARALSKNDRENDVRKHLTQINRGSLFVLLRFFVVSQYFFFLLFVLDQSIIYALESAHGY